MDPPAPKRSRKEEKAEAKFRYKSLSSQVKELQLIDDNFEKQKLIKQQLKATKELYPLVKKKLAGTAVDAKHMKNLVKACHEAAKKINEASKSFDLARSIRRLRQEASDARGSKIKNRLFFPQVQEKHVEKFLCRPPTFSFIYGTLKSEDLRHQKREFRRRERVVAAEPITAVSRDIAVDVQQDSTPKEVEYIYEQVKRMDKGRGLPLFQTIVDPTSFMKTVENFFHISFLVKAGKFEIKKQNNKAVLSHQTGPKAEDKSRQSILSFSIKDYESWIEKFNIKTRAFPAAS